MGIRREVASRPETLELRQKPREVRLGRLGDMKMRQR